MNIIVCIKQVPDTEAKIKIAPDGKSIDFGDTKMVLNPYDEIALEAGLQLKEKEGGEVTVICLGNKGATSSIRTALAMGAGKAVHLEVEDFTFDSYSIAAKLAEDIKDREYDLVICGKQAIDDDNLQVPSMLAELLGIPSATVITSIEFADGKIKASREIEGGSEQLELATPALVSTQKGLCEPRYPSLKGIMMAKKKPIEVKASSLDASAVEVLSMNPPAERAEGKIVGEGSDAAAELARLLREEAKVI